MSKPRPRHTAVLSRWDKKGLTFIELLVVILILGVLASIAIMVLLDFKEKGCVATLASDLSSAYDASIQYHVEHSGGLATYDILRGYGYRPSKDVDLSVVDGNLESLKITATHPGARGVYQVDQDGYVSKQ